MQIWSPTLKGRVLKMTAPMAPQNDESTDWRGGPSKLSHGPMFTSLGENASWRRVPPFLRQLTRPHTDRTPHSISIRRTLRNMRSVDAAAAFN